MSQTESDFISDRSDQGLCQVLERQCSVSHSVAVQEKPSFAFGGPVKTGVDVTIQKLLCGLWEVRSLSASNLAYANDIILCTASVGTMRRLLTACDESPQTFMLFLVQ